MSNIDDQCFDIDTFVVPDAGLINMLAQVIAEKYESARHRLLKYLVTKKCSLSHTMLMSL